MPDDRQPDGADIVRRRHAEWQCYSLNQRWMLDSLEGGQQYRNAVYGTDRHGLPIRNLVRHKREYPDPREASNGGLNGDTAYIAGTSSLFAATNSPMLDPIGMDPSQYATDGDYEMRRARTPVPTFVKEAVENDLSQIYAREVRRVAPESLTAWWEDVDGCGTPIDRWMKETIGPLLMTLGGLDLIFDHPAAPEGEAVESRADTSRLGLDRCVANYILPENMMWWRLDGDRPGVYAECLVREHAEDEDGSPVVRFRHWTASGWVLYDDHGDELTRGDHPFGRVPIRRIFDRRKPRRRNTPQSRYESIAEFQREYYNRDSELILSDTTQAHPLLQGPEDYIQADGTLPIGPSWLLPKKKSGQNGAYEGFEVIQFGKEGAASIRLNKNDIREAVDRDAKLLRPAGSHAVEKGTVEQSAISKQIDYQPAHHRLAQIADTLERCEQAAAAMALLVLGDGKADPGDVEIVYPSNFDLYSSSDTAIAISDFQKLSMQTGLPGMEDIEKALLKRQIRLVYPGLPDAMYVSFDSDIDEFIDSGGGLKVQADQAEAAMQARQPLDPAGNVRAGVKDPTARINKPNTPVKPKPVDESSSG